MLDFSFFCVKIYINVVNLFNLFTKQCFKYIMKTCVMIWNESNKDIVLKSTYKIL
jgi:hypothetical protein